MKKILLACDLDNTLIHSWRHKREDDICIEILKDKEQGFTSPKTFALIEKVTALEDYMLVPVTTRSIVQYKRIQWPKACTPEYALVSNGTILLKNGEVDEDWRKEAACNILPYQEEIKRLYEKFSQEKCFEVVKIVDDMYLFGYYQDEAWIQNFAGEFASQTILDVEYTGHKLYFFPPVAKKGVALKKLADRLGADYVIAAGDSKIDYSMLEVADMAIVPNKSVANDLENTNVKVCDENELFSEFLLDAALSVK